MTMKFIRLCLFIALVLLFSIIVSANHLVKLNICDDLGGTKLVKEKVTLCSDQDVYKAIDSIQLLAKTNAKPYTDTLHTPHVTFLYDEPAPGAKKVVKAIRTYNLAPESELELGDLGSFSLNFVSGRSIMLIFEEGYYLLTNSTAMDLFSFENTKLVHIPTGTEFASQNVKGTAWYVFETLGQRRIALGAVGEIGAEVLVSSLEPGEVPAAFVKPYDLTKLHEVQFTFNTPIKITDPVAVGQLAVCQADNPADTQQVMVCRNDKEQFTLKKDTLTLRNIDGKYYAFLYQYQENEKRISLLKIQDVSRSFLALDKSLSLNYNDFINSMIAGRRMAVKFNENLYLLEHPIFPAFSLLDLSLVAYQEGKGTTTLTAVGGEDAVEFTGLKGEKIYLQRNYGTPPPPFQLNGKSVEEQEPVDLSQQLFTSLSSTGAVTIVVPPYGKLTAALSDTKLYQPTFKISMVKDSKVTDYTLSYKQPSVVEGNLFYYHTAEISGSTPIKTTSIYKLYNLDSGPSTKPFNDKFIAVFTGGKELALGYKGSYYLLGHKGTGAVKFYDPAQLTLRKLDGTEDFQVSVEDGVAKFTVPEGRIDVSVDLSANTMAFSATTIQEATAVQFEQYMTELTTENLIKIGDSTLQLCFQQVYAAYPSAKVCDINKKIVDPTGKALDFIADPVTGLTPAVTIANKRYILESNGQAGSNKKVFIRSLLELKKGTLLQMDPSNQLISWTKLIDDVIAKKHPVFNLSGVLYMPSAKDSKLENLVLAPFPAGTPQYTIRNLKQLTPVSFKGNFILGDTILFVEQKETTNEEVPLIVSFFVPEYSYLPEEGTPIKLNTSEGIKELKFVAQLDQESANIKPFILKVVAVSADGELVKLSLQSGEEILFNRWFAKDELRELTVDQANFEIKIQQVDKVKKIATIIVRRIL